MLVVCPHQGTLVTVVILVVIRNIAKFPLVPLVQIETILVGVVAGLIVLTTWHVSGKMLIAVWGPLLLLVLTRCIAVQSEWFFFSFLCSAT